MDRNIYKELICFDSKGRPYELNISLKEIQINYTHFLEQANILKGIVIPELDTYIYVKDNNINYITRVYSLNYRGHLAYNLHKDIESIKEKGKPFFYPYSKSTNSGDEFIIVHKPLIVRFTWLKTYILVSMLEDSNVFLGAQMFSLVNNRVYKTPYPNIYDSGNICLGNDFNFNDYRKNSKELPTYTIIRALNEFYSDGDLVSQFEQSYCSFDSDGNHIVPDKETTYLKPLSTPNIRASVIEIIKNL